MYIFIRVLYAEQDNISAAVWFVGHAEAPRLPFRLQLALADAVIASDIPKCPTNT